MSMIGSFIGALLMLAPRAKPVETDERQRLLDRIAFLQREVAAECQRANLWRQAALRLRRNEPLPPLVRVERPLPLREGDWLQLGQMAQNALAQQNQQAMAQYAQNQQLAAYQGGQLGMQGRLNPDPGQWPSCTPSRREALTGRLTSR